MHQKDDEGVEWLDEAGYEPGEVEGCGESGKLEIIDEEGT